MKKIIILFSFILISNIAFSQVGINTNNPNPLTELDIKNIVNGDTIPKGIMIPRITTNQRDAINVTDIILANGLLIYNTDEDCYNYFNKIANEWSSLCGKLGKATFEITDCNNIKVAGQYLTKTPLSSFNYLTVKVKVTKPGSYSITAMPSPDNGYYFSTSGEFLTTGDFELTLMGAGTPINFTPLGNQGDEVKLTLNGVVAPCSVFIPIEDSSIKPMYSMNCGNTRALGVYKINKALDASHYIEVTLTADAEAIGSTYILQTNTIDGISFKGQGLLTSTNQVIKLVGTGTPTSTTEKIFTITSNSQKTVATCSARVIVLIPKKRLLTIGSSENGFGYNFSGTAASNKLITTATNFGALPNSTVKTEGFTIIDGGTNPSATQIKDWLTGSNPVDIVILGFDNANISSTIASYYAQYLSNGGVVIAFQDRTEALISGNFLNTILNDYSLSMSYATGPGSIYQFPYLNNEILNGPFGDIRGLQWGEDASTTVRINVPTTSIDVLSGDRDLSTTSSNGTAGYVTAFKHKTLNLIWVGDGGFNSNDAGTSYTICPFKLNASNFPVAKSLYGRGANRLPVYNSVFTANALAWALQQAEFNGINSGK